MPRQKQHQQQQVIDGGFTMEEDTSKIRKRGCSPTPSSSSSIIQNYRFKRAVLVGKRGGVGSSSTPLPTWRIMASRSPSIALRAAAAASAAAVETPRSQASRVPVSARKLAATLWEMNEVSTPRTVAEGRGGGSCHKRREKVGKGGNLVSNGLLLPSHLSDPSHSPVSERSDRSGIIGNNRRHRQSSSGRRLKSSTANNDHGVVDSASNASFMEVETRSRCHTPSVTTATTGSTRTRLKDISSALTTSKELLKIINRIRSQEDNHHHRQSSSSTSLISALNTELERASLQVTQLIHEQQQTDTHRAETDSLLKQFARERAAWKNREREVVDAAIESVAGELEVERKLRRRVESLNKRLGKELAETKEELVRVVKEVESERLVRGEMERVCGELAWELGSEVVEEAEGISSRRGGGREDEAGDRERDMLRAVDILREERARKHHHQLQQVGELKSDAGDQRRHELETFIEKAAAAAHYRARYGDEERETGAGAGEVESGTDDGEESGDSDLHSIELSKDGYGGRRDLKLGAGAGAYVSSSSPMPRLLPPRSSSRLINEVVEDVKGRRSVYNSSGGSKDHNRRSGSSLLRTMSDVVGFGIGGHSQSSPHRPGAAGDFDPQQQHRRSCGDHDLQRYRSVKGLREQILSSYRNKDTASPARKWG